MVQGWEMELLWGLSIGGIRAIILIEGWFERGTRVA